MSTKTKLVLSLDQYPGFMPAPPDGMDYAIEVDSIQPCWLSDVQGDPGRTLDERHARRYDDIGFASLALSQVKAAHSRRTYRIGIIPKQLCPV